MGSKKELGTKHIKRIMDRIKAPGLSQKQIINLINFSVTTNEKEIIYLLNSKKEISFFNYEGIFLPSLQVFRKISEIEIPSVSVDEGAVPYLLNGADVFSSGITEINEVFQKDEIITVKNPQGHILCVGLSMESSNAIRDKKGKAIKNIHFLGDKIWENQI